MQNSIFDLLGPGRADGEVRPACPSGCLDLLLDDHFHQVAALTRAGAQRRRGFLDVFWHGKNIDEIFGKIEKSPTRRSPPFSSPG